MIESGLSSYHLPQTQLLVSLCCDICIDLLDKIHYSSNFPSHMRRWNQTPFRYAACSRCPCFFAFALGATCKIRNAGVKVVERTRGNTGIPKRMVRSAGNEIGRSMWP